LEDYSHLTGYIGWQTGSVNVNVVNVRKRKMTSSSVKIVVD
jgi:hypothetical protein